MDDLKRVINATKKPVNALVAGPYADYTLADYAALGAARLSFGSALARVTHKAIQNAAHAMFTNGQFTPLKDAASGAEINALLT